MAVRKNSVKIATTELLEVYQWVRQFRLSKEVKNMNRDLLDGVLVAEILKQLYPKYVDLHNYTKCCSMRNKLDNWQTLNQKVLRRLNIYLNDGMLYDLASGSGDILGVLLFEIMTKQRQESCTGYQSAEEQDENAIFGRETSNARAEPKDVGQWPGE